MDSNCGGIKEMTNMRNATSSLFVFITSEAETAPFGPAAGHTKAALINTQDILLKIHQPRSAWAEKRIEIHFAQNEMINV